MQTLVAVLVKMARQNNKGYWTKSLLISLVSFSLQNQNTFYVLSPNTISAKDHFWWRTHFRPQTKLWNSTSFKRPIITWKWSKLMLNWVIVSKTTSRKIRITQCLTFLAFIDSKYCLSVKMSLWYQI